MKLKELQANWEGLAQTDPFWAVLSDPGKRNQKWKKDELLKTGEEEIERVFEFLKSLNISIKPNIALDFGCGVGRLTQALCRYFRRCYGIDISMSMIKLAEKFNRYGDKCSYQINASTDLKCFETQYFDFVCSILVLQHMKPEYSKNYIKEFIRVLAPGGVLVFQIPSELISISETPYQSGIPEALPDSAFKARISVEEPSITAKAGYQVPISVRVTNISDYTWPADHKSAIRLGNHWLRSDGSLLVRDDGRANLPARLAPMEDVELSLTVTTPTVPGEYLIEFDLVQESVAWFKDKSSETKKVHFVVKSNDFTNQPHSTIIKPSIEIYGVHKDEVIELIRSSGGDVIEILDDPAAGKEWQSFRYYVTK